MRIESYDLLNSQKESFYLRKKGICFRLYSLENLKQQSDHIIKDLQTIPIEAQIIIVLYKYYLIQKKSTLSQ